MQQEKQNIDTPSELVALIDGLSDKPPVVGISGFGGAGKSSLADRLARHYGIHDQQIVRIDTLYAINPLGPGVFDQIDLATLEALLKDLARRPARLVYQGRRYRGEPLRVDEPIPPVLLIEGVRLFQPHLMSLFDLSLWIDCPQDVALARAKERDRRQGETEDEIALWDTHWGPLDRAYFGQFRPDLLADVRFTQQADCTA